MGASGVMPVDDLDDRLVEVFQAVQDEFVAVAQIVRQPVHDRLAGLQYHFVDFRERDICFFHDALFSAPSFGSA